MLFINFYNFTHFVSHFGSHFGRQIGFLKANGEANCPKVLNNAHGPKSNDLISYAQETDLDFSYCIHCGYGGAYF